MDERKRAEDERQKLNAELMTASRLAGMAEMATTVLHNVGNVLNSANVSADLLNKDGHGFGLHGAIATAREMGGDLQAYSAGKNRGATFTLYLPAEPPKKEQPDA